MDSMTGFVFVYLLGGLTLIPLVLVALFIHAYLFLPARNASSTFEMAGDDGIRRRTDDGANLKSGADVLAEQFTRKHESDVAAGYFAVCREYVPGGVNGKPPERTTPSGEIIAAESPSVYQSMYRSIFDRQLKPTIHPSSLDGKPVKRARNVFFIVLRHGHLMLYDDSEQLEVRHVIALEHHDVSIYGGPEKIPEGELWIRRNAICLARNKRQTVATQATSLPFFLFCENCSEKEDFYLTLLKNQGKIPDSKKTPPVPQEYGIKDIITLVKKLHFSEEQLETRWLNALIGRLFLGLYRTPELEQFVRNKMSKKISRVKKPNFITKIVLQKVDLGEGAPFITNPKLKDLTVNGECTAEADLQYSGKFRIEIAATARINLGTRFKAREVELVLSVVVNKLEGHGLLRFKPPPSNRVWIAFEKMPHLELKIEPLVSSRQITYNVVLRAIESRIREVVAETVVLPFWDDIPFLDTTAELFRGGIWKKAVDVQESVEIKPDIPEEEADAGEAQVDVSEDLIAHKDDMILSEAHLPPSSPGWPKSRSGRAKKPAGEETGQMSPTAPDKLQRPEPLRALRSNSFATVADPMMSPSHADGGGSRRTSDAAQRKGDAKTILQELSNKSTPASPWDPPNETLSKDAATVAPSKAPGGLSPRVSGENLSTLLQYQHSRTSSAQSNSPIPAPSTPNVNNVDSKTWPSEEPARAATVGSTRSLPSSTEKRAAINLSAATNAAKNWGWGVLARNQQRDEATARNSKLGTPELPMGRGKPFPPPGQPLPHPERSFFGTLPLPRRKVVPPAASSPPERGGSTSSHLKPTPPPSLPERRKRQSAAQADDQPDEVLVVEAPVDTNPSTPSEDEGPSEPFEHKEDANGSISASTRTETEALPQEDAEAKSG